MKSTVILSQQRLRTTEGSFCYIPHRFLRGGFLKSLHVEESLLYLFYVLAGDRNGVSFYSDTVIIEQLGIQINELNHARKGLLQKGLISCQKPHVQVLSLPSYAEKEINPARKIRNQLLEKKNDFR